MYFITLTDTDGKKASGAQSLYSGSKRSIKLHAWSYFNLIMLIRQGLKKVYKQLAVVFGLPTHITSLRRPFKGG